MSAIRRDERYLRTGVVEAVDLPRRQLLVLVLLTCVPVPLLTLGGLAVPFPEFAQRALAPLLPFVDVPGGETSAGGLEAVRAVSIVNSPAETSAANLTTGSATVPGSAPSGVRVVGATASRAPEVSAASPPVESDSGSEAAVDAVGTARVDAAEPAGAVAESAGSQPDQDGTPPGQATPPAQGTPSDQGGTPPDKATPPDPGGTPPDPGGTPPDQGGTPPDQGGTAPSQATPPGQGGTPPGQGGTPPGQGGTPPDQGGTPPGQGGTPPGQGGTPPGQGAGNGNGSGQGKGKP